MSDTTKVIKGAGTLVERIRDWMRQHPDGGFSGDIAAQLRINADRVSVALLDMFQRGELTRCIVDRPGHRSQFWWRASATLGVLRSAVPWKEFTVSPSLGPRRSPAPGTPVHHVRDPAEGVAEKAPPGRLPTPSGGAAPGSAVSALVPPAAAPAAAETSPAQRTDPSSPSRGGAEVGMGQAAAERPVGEPAPAAAMTTEALGNVPMPAGHQTRDDLRAACDRWLSGNGVALDTTPPPAPTSLASALALATAEDRAPYGGQPRFALYSDGTLLLEGLPNLPPIIAIRPEHSRALVAYLRGEGHA